MSEPPQLPPRFPPAAFTGSAVAERNDHALAFPHDSPMIQALSFLPWELSVPRKAVLPDWALLSICLPVCSFADNLNTQYHLSSISPLFLTLTATAITRILVTLSNCGLFEAPIPFAAIRGRLADALATAQANGTQLNLVLSASDVTTTFAPSSSLDSSSYRNTHRSVHSSDEPSAPANPMPVPPPFAFLFLAKTASFSFPDPLPLAALADFKLLLGNTSSPAVVNTPTAECHLVAERMHAAVRDVCKVSHASDLLVSASVASFLRSLRLFPSSFTCDSLDCRLIAEDFADRCT
eukprot:4760209-Pleurochrysis_carterae.AAC.1